MIASRRLQVEIEFLQSTLGMATVTLYAVLNGIRKSAVSVHIVAARVH